MINHGNGIFTVKGLTEAHEAMAVRAKELRAQNIPLEKILPAIRGWAYSLKRAHKSIYINNTAHITFLAESAGQFENVAIVITNTEY